MSKKEEKKPQAPKVPEVIDNSIDDSSFFKRHEDMRKKIESELKGKTNSKKN